jgi:hypothetical protein
VAGCWTHAFGGLCRSYVSSRSVNRVPTDGCGGSCNHRLARSTSLCWRETTGTEGWRGFAYLGGAQDCPGGVCLRQEVLGACAERDLGYVSAVCRHPGRQVLGLDASPAAAAGIGVPQPGACVLGRDQPGLPGAGHASPGAGAGRRRRCAPGRAPADPGPGLSAARLPVRRRERRWLSPRSPPGLQYVPGRRQSAASQSASRSIARSRMRGDGGIAGLGGCKIGSGPGLVRAGNAGPRSL